MNGSSLFQADTSMVNVWQQIILEQYSQSTKNWKTVRVWLQEALIESTTLEGLTKLH